MLLGISFTLLKSAPSSFITVFKVACSIGDSHVEYVFPSSPFGLSMPLPFLEIIPDVLCWINPATAVIPSGLSESIAAAIVSCASIANCACPDAHIVAAPFSGGCTISTSSPASS